MSRATRKTGLSAFGGTTAVQPVEFDISSQAPVEEPEVREVSFTTNQAYQMLQLDKPLTSTQIDKLSNARYSDGSLIVDIPNKKGYDALNEIGHLLRHLPASDVISYLTDPPRKDLSDLIWHSPLIVDELKNLEEEQDLEIQVEGKEGVGVCKLCGCKFILVISIQNRSCDEATTIKYRCSACMASGPNINVTAGE